MSEKTIEVWVMGQGFPMTKSQLEETIQDLSTELSLFPDDKDQPRPESGKTGGEGLANERAI